MGVVRAGEGVLIESRNRERRMESRGSRMTVVVPRQFSILNSHLSISFLVLLA